MNPPNDFAIVIEPVGRRALLRFDDLRGCGDLFRYLVKRNLTARYRQTLLGAVWGVLQPLMLALVYSVFIGALAKVPAPTGIPYAVFALSGMVMWLLFAGALASAAQSTLGDTELISKVYFPRILLPVSAVAPAIFDFVLAFAVLLVVMVAYGVAINPLVLVGMPVGLLLASASALGLGLWLAALQVRYRDVQHVIPFVLIVGLFITPIVYPFSLVPDALQPLYALNPMVGVLDFFRWSVLPDQDLYLPALALSVGMGAFLLVGGTVFFRRREHGFADLI
jgi:lipopolysaccharide transport system permease protein